LPSRPGHIEGRLAEAIALFHLLGPAMSLRDARDLKLMAKRRASWTKSVLADDPQKPMGTVFLAVSAYRNPQSGGLF